MHNILYCADVYAADTHARPRTETVFPTKIQTCAPRPYKLCDVGEFTVFRSFTEKNVYTHNFIEEKPLDCKNRFDTVAFLWI